MEGKDLSSKYLTLLQAKNFLKHFKLENLDGQKKQKRKKLQRLTKDLLSKGIFKST